MANKRDMYLQSFLAGGNMGSKGYSQQAGQEFTGKENQLDRESRERIARQQLANSSMGADKQKLEFYKKEWQQAAEDFPAAKQNLNWWEKLSAAYAPDFLNDYISQSNPELRRYRQAERVLYENPLRIKSGANMNQTEPPGGKRTYIPGMYGTNIAQDEQFLRERGEAMGVPGPTKSAGDPRKRLEELRAKYRK